MFLSKEAILKSFPFSFRGNQEQTLNKLADAINREEIKYVILQIPTGGGKSPIAMSLANTKLDSFILTSNKMLQDQYTRDFPNDLNDLRGRSNYRCNTHQGFNCAGSPCRSTSQGRSQCAKERACEYHIALESASKGNTASMNFAAAISFLNYTPYFEHRSLLIIDEAHLIPDNLTNFIEFSVSSQQLNKLLPYGAGESGNIPNLATAQEYLPWLRILQGKIEDAVENFTAPNKVDIATGSTIKFEDVENFARKVGKIIEEITKHKDNLVVDQIYVDHKRTILDKISFKPIDVSRYAKDNLFKFAEKTVMMSATIINYKEFINSLGISEEEAVFIDVPSTFPKDNRPLIRNYVGQLNKNNLHALMPEVIKSIKEVLINHKNEKGIIHTHTYDIAKRIVQELNSEFGNRLLFPVNASKQTEILAMHAASKVPTVLISPSMTEGVDLKDDLSRFQIIVKVPYPSLGDKVVKARMERRPEWYGFRTLLTLIQAYGRSTRSETDSAVTYILDGAFEGLLSRNKKSLPIWFTEAII